MQNQYFDRWNEAAQAAWKPLLELSEITTRAVERSGQQQLAFLNTYLKDSADYARSFSTFKDPKDAFALQSKLAGEYGDKVYNQARLNMESCLEVSGELTRWWENAFEAFTVMPVGRAA